MVSLSRGLTQAPSPSGGVLIRRPPVPADFPNPIPRRNAHPVAGRQQPDVTHDGQWLRDRAVSQVTIQPLAVQLAGDQPRLEQSTKLAREKEPGTDLRVVQRLDAEPIAAQEKLLLGRIPKRECKHPPESLDGSPSPMAVRGQEGLRVAR